MLFRDRVDAGRQLARAAIRYRGQSPIVLGLPRGGVPVAYEVARALDAPLDVWVVRKVGAPGHEELGLGAVAEGGEAYLDREIMAAVGASDEEVGAIVDRKAAEVDERVRMFRGDRPAPELEGRTVIVVDDGIATGGTVRAALRAIRQHGPARLVLAVPVAAGRTLQSLRTEADEVLCLDVDPYLSSIGEYYVDFGQTSDDEVLALLESARRGYAEESGGAGEREQELPVEIEVDGARLQGDLRVPEGAAGLVLFAHGSGSGRFSPRNRFVARVLQRAGLGTLLMDLLTPEEEELDEAGGRFRFDVNLLADRLLGAARWARARGETARLYLGYFGASTGAAAALIAAARRPDLVEAVVSRGGRADLAGPYLGEVRAPTLFIVGSADIEVLGLNEEAFQHMQAPRQVAVVPGATHLFEEPGALDEVARAAAEWFVHHLAPQALTRAG